MNKLKCIKCKYKWIARVAKPKACPNCHCRKWNCKEVK